MTRLMQAARARPLMAILVTAGSAAGAVLAMLQLSGQLDAMVVSEAELAAVMTKHESQPHDAAEDLIRKKDRQQTCRYIDLQISILDGQIYQMEQSGEETPRLIEKRRELKNLETERDSLGCSEVR